jgi:hypothetical protein
MEPPTTPHTTGGRAVDVTGPQGSFPMPYDCPEWSRSNPEDFLEKCFPVRNRDFHHLWRYFEDFAVSVSLSHSQ